MPAPNGRPGAGETRAQVGRSGEDEPKPRPASRSRRQRSAGAHLLPAPADGPRREGGRKAWFTCAGERFREVALRLDGDGPVGRRAAPATGGLPCRRRDNRRTARRLGPGLFSPTGGPRAQRSAEGASATRQRVTEPPLTTRRAALVVAPTNRDSLSGLPSRSGAAKKSGAPRPKAGRAGRVRRGGVGSSCSLRAPCLG